MDIKSANKEKILKKYNSLFLCVVTAYEKILGCEQQKFFCFLFSLKFGYNDSSLVTKAPQMVDFGTFFKPNGSVVWKQAHVMLILPGKELNLLYSDISLM